MSNAPPALGSLLERVRATAEASGLFGPVTIKGGQLVCVAKEAAAPASYRIFEEGGRLHVSLVMADRWLSESIESDLVDHGDHVEDLLEEELVEHGAPATRLAVEHFRSEDLLFTFRSPLPIERGDWESVGASEAAWRFLAGYEACFRNLGDMSGGGDE